MRLDKYLADLQFGSRNDIKKMIKNKLVKVDDKIICDAAYKVDENSNVYVNDEKIEYVSYEYYLLNKPAGYICANEDDLNPTVFELISSVRADLSTVGRLDKDTYGALLITNDGQLNHRLTSSKNHVDKVYYFKCDQQLPINAKQLLESKMDLGDFESLGGHFEQESNNSGYLTIWQGKYHQVKRMLEKIGCHINYLERINFDILDCKGLEVGQYRHLTNEEIAILKSR